jgi:hypothetical protein
MEMNTSASLESIGYVKDKEMCSSAQEDLLFFVKAAYCCLSASPEQVVVTTA